MKTLFICIFSGIILSLQAQQNVDSIFNKAISESRISNYDNAIIEANKALQADTLRADICVFIANVYSWKNNNDSALIYISKANKLNSKTEEYYDAYLNILLRSKKYEDLIIVCDEAEKNNYANKKNLVTKKMLALEGIENYKAIVNLAETKDNKPLLADNAINYIYGNAKNKIKFQNLSASYTIDLFQEIDPHHLASIAYSNKIKNTSTGIALNYANRYDKSDIQLEYTGYKILKNENYWYLNYGYGFGASLFPKHRTGLEYYFKIKPKWDGSIGGRYLYYPLVTDKNIWIFTAHTGVYIQNSWVSIRPFYVVKKDLKSLSFAAKYRLYESNPTNFWGLELGLGNSPDDMYTTSQGSFNELMSYRLKMEKNFSIAQNSELLLGLSYVFEEIYQGSSINNRNRFVIDLSYRFKF